MREPLTAPPGAAPAAPPARRRVLGWLKLAVLAAVVLLGALVVARRWDELRDALGRLSWPAVLAAAAFAALAQLAGVRAYRTVLADLGSPLPFVPTARVYFVSQLGKYVPGTVWAMVALVELSRDYRVPRRTSLAAGILALVLSVATALTLGVLLLPFGAAGAARHYRWLVLLVPVLVAALHPRVVTAVLDRAVRIARRPPLTDRMTYGGTLRAAGWQALSWLLFGLHAWVLVLGVGAAGGARTLAAAVGGFALSYGMGPLFVVAPAGAGVREAGIVLTLGGVAGPAGALAVALVSRAALVAVDFAQAGAWTLAARRSPAAPGAGRSGAPR